MPFFVLVLLSCLNLSGANIKGMAVDATNETPLENATIRIMNATDSSFVSGGMTDQNGAFFLNGFKSGKYIVKITYLGYTTQFINANVQESEDLGKISMHPDGVILKETEVMGIKTEVKVMQDSVEYNAGSYKTQPNAVVEDLLKRLPGVEVDSDGNIKAQGKEVKKILVDGKEFFSDDAKVASKNIPVSMVETLQVINRTSDLARLTGVDDGEDETVINLRIKKGMKKGWFGNATAGYGTDDRHMGNFMVNRFKNDNQFSLLGNFNNINDPGFSSQSMGKHSFSPSYEGINTTQSLGINFNVGNEEIFRVGGDVLYAHSDLKGIRSANKQYLFADSTSYENSDRESRAKSHYFSGNFRMKWEIDSFNTLEFRPKFEVNINDSRSFEQSLLRAGDADFTKINQSTNHDFIEGTSYDLDGRFVYNHEFKRRIGRSLSMMVNYRYSNNKEDQTSKSINQFFLAPEDDETTERYTDYRQWTNRVGGRISWKEPIGDLKKMRFLTFAYKIDYRFNDADKLVYNINKEFSPEKAQYILENEYGIQTNAFSIRYLMDDNQFTLDEILSNRFRNEQFTQSMRIGFQQTQKQARINVGLSVNPTMMSSEDLINSERNIDPHWVWNFAPFARVRFSFSKTKSFAVDYRGWTNPPTIRQMQPVPNMTNPMKIIVGNPNLLPAFHHNISIRFNNFVTETQRSIMAAAHISIKQNSIVSKTHFDSTTGVQTSTFDNVDGAWNAYAMAMYTMPFRNRRWSFSNHTFARFARAVGYNNGNINHSNTFSINEMPSIAYRTDVFDIELRPFYDFQITRNTNQKQSDRNIHSYGTNFNANYYTPFGLVLNTDLAFNKTNGYTQGFDREEWLWNASVSYQFLKGKEATVTVKAYDLLGQNKDISRAVTANYIQDSQFNTATRYFMFSFTYNFKIFGKDMKAKDFNYDEFEKNKFNKYGHGHPHGRMGGYHREGGHPHGM